MGIVILKKFYVINNTIYDLDFNRIVEIEFRNKRKNRYIIKINNDIYTFDRETEMYEWINNDLGDLI